ncbi:MAG: transcriptional repressor NrdR [Armatimonadetes bacterium]|nr:transcriptional repressor NrdR [Armatimonadota bacterium]
MRCPYCGASDKDHVLDSRPVRDGAAIKRRRECETCRGRFTTFEEIEEMRLMVIKGKDRGREPYRREKLRRAIELACKKRPVTDAQIEATVDEIERKLYSSQEKEVSSSDIGEMVMDRLRSLDQVAYIRFASVYRQFEDVRQFRQLVDRIGTRRPAKTRDAGVPPAQNDNE